MKTTSELMDGKVTLDEMKELIEGFCTERDWDRFHNPKDLAIGIVTEGAELLEIFRFKTPEECAEMFADENRRTMIEDELADAFYFVLRFAQMNDIDLSEALSSKLLKNGDKYPVEKSRGCNRKYNEF